MADQELTGGGEGRVKVDRPLLAMLLAAPLLSGFFSTVVTFVMFGMIPPEPHPDSDPGYVLIFGMILSPPLGFSAGMVHSALTLAVLGALGRVRREPLFARRNAFAIPAVNIAIVAFVSVATQHWMLIYMPLGASISVTVVGLLAVRKGGRSIVDASA